MRVVVLGCNRAGNLLAERMTANHHRVVMLDEHIDCSSSLKPPPHITVIEPSGDLAEDLVKCGIDHCDLFIALSSNDNLNALATQIATHTYNLPTALCHIGDLDKRDAYAELGLSTLSATAMLADDILGRIQDSY